MKRFFVLSIATGFLLLNFTACDDATEKTAPGNEVQVVGAMRQVMWEGRLGPQVHLDSLANTPGRYGLGPLAYLKGEVLIVDGTVFESRVVNDSTMVVAQNNQVSAPFFVYGTVNNWQRQVLPDSIKNIAQLEAYLAIKAADLPKPFAFKLEGTITEGQIHIQNLPDGAKVSSPQEAHQGQINYPIAAQEVTIIGFYSTQHKGVFTHHDSNVHLHLITADKTKMGHLDWVTFDKINLSLPQ